MMIQIFPPPLPLFFGGGGNEFFFGPKTKRGGGKNWIGKFNSITLSSLFLCLCTQRLPLYTRASTHFERRRKRTLFFLLLLLSILYTRDIYYNVLRRKNKRRRCDECLGRVDHLRGRVVPEGVQDQARRDDGKCAERFRDQRRYRRQGGFFKSAGDYVTRKLEKEYYAKQRTS